MPYFSIITAVYNAEKVIEPTLNSVLSQSFSDFEYIIIDGKSKDKTLEIVERLKDKIDLVISEPDKGVYDAMNKGLIHAKGEFVLFMNAGDEFEHAHILENIYQKSKNADLLYGETNIINEERRVIGTRSELTTRKLPSQLKKSDYLSGQVVSHQSFIAKRSLTKPYNLQYQCSADIDWMLHIVSQAKIIVNVEGPVSRYLQGGISDTQLLKCWSERFTILLNHFSLVSVLWAHVKFVVRYLKIGQYKK